MTQEIRSDTAMCCMMVTINLFSLIPLGAMEAARMMESPIRDERSTVQKKIIREYCDVLSSIQGIA